MTQHKLQNNRFELKYVIDEQRARAMRDDIRGYVQWDEHVQDLRNCSYPVHSLYLDAPTLVLYRQTTLGLKNRFKLRIRFYDDLPGHPAFLEIKRRLNDAIRKERAAITRAGVDRLLKGRPLGPADLIPANGNGRAGGVLERFCHLVEELGAQPAAYVSYVREAYVSPGSDQLRVTFDRHIRGAPSIGGWSSPRPRQASPRTYTASCWNSNSSTVFRTGCGIWCGRSTCNGVPCPSTCSAWRRWGSALGIGWRRGRIAGQQARSVCRPQVTAHGVCLLLRLPLRAALRI